MYKKKGKDLEEIKELLLERRKIPSLEPIDPNYRRLLYLRYADDFVILIIGNRNDAIQIKG
jgi:RNA-directed DNA polymerase